MPSLVFGLVIITLVTLGVGFLGLRRIRKDRPLLKSYEQRQPSGSMGSDTHPMSNSDVETAFLSEESHMRAPGHENTTSWRHMMWGLWQLTGIPLLSGSITSSSTMGNTPTPKHPLLLSPTIIKPVEVVRNSKTSTVDADESYCWSEEDLVSSDEEDHITTDEDPMEYTKVEETRCNPFLMDGLEFYTTVASVSTATVVHAIDIALFRATTIVLHERRKAYEDASIQAIEMLYPDIMCLPPHANVCYGGPMKPQPTMTRATPMSPSKRQVETRFLTAA